MDTAADDVVPLDTSGQGLVDSTFEVEVKLAVDTDNPLSSISTFEELGL